MKYSRFGHIIFIICLLSLLAYDTSLGQRITGTNIDYEEGDWVSYTQCRFINSIQVAPDMVYIATEGGILRFDYLSREWLFPFTVSNGLPENYIFAAALDVATNLLWCSTSEAVSVYDRGTYLWQNYYFDELGITASDPVLSFGFDETGVWLETRSGQNYFSPLNEVQFFFNNEEPDSNVSWFGARGFSPDRLDFYFLPNSLLFIDDAVNYYIQDINLRNFLLSYYLIDPWQSLWAGTDGLGVFTADTRMGQMTPLTFGLLNPDVRALAKDGKNIWLGGIQKDVDIKGITKWNGKKSTWSYYEPRYISRFRSEEIQNILVRNRSVWFATLDGLTLYQQDSDQWQTFTVFDGLQDNVIYSIAGQDSIIWVGSNDGLDAVKINPNQPDSIQIYPVTKPKDKIAIYDILLDNNYVWAGSEVGLYFYDRQKKVGGYYRGADGPGVEPVIAIDKLRDSLWVATVYTVEVYDLKNRLWRGNPGRKIFSDVRILDLVAADEAIWVGTEDGLFKHQVAKGYWKKYTSRDGLLNHRVQKLLVDGDYLWIGSPYGLTRFLWNSPYRID